MKIRTLLACLALFSGAVQLTSCAPTDSGGEPSGSDDLASEYEASLRLLLDSTAT